MYPCLSFKISDDQSSWLCDISQFLLLEHGPLTVVLKLHCAQESRVGQGGGLVKMGFPWPQHQKVENRAGVGLRSRLP